MRKPIDPKLVSQDCTHCRREMFLPGRGGIGQQETKPVYTFACYLGHCDSSDIGPQPRMASGQNLCANCRDFSPRE